jgi:hypothetical protein
METGDRDFCRAALERSLAVAEVMTAARREAGIWFPGEAQ